MLSTLCTFRSSTAYSGYTLPSRWALFIINFPENVIVLKMDTILRFTLSENNLPHDFSLQLWIFSDYDDVSGMWIELVGNCCAACFFSSILTGWSCNCMTREIELLHFILQDTIGGMTISICERKISHHRHHNFPNWKYCEEKKQFFLRHPEKDSHLRT